MGGLKSWYEHIFEKLGWIAITDDLEKKEYYKRGIDKFLQSAKIAREEYMDHNRKLDVDAMCANVEELRDFVAKCL